jgi:PPK2 family polyphosphate:nucleotide phosphotransferase
MADTRARTLTELIAELRVPPGVAVDLARDRDPGYTAGRLQKKEAKEQLELSVKLLAEYQERLAAQERYGMLVVLQGIDASGKDGTITHVMSGVNPQGVSVHAFEAPSQEELHHDFLWRYQRRLPERGSIGIFNRSHYEEVLVVRVHSQLLERQLIPEATRKDIWQRRYEQINDWERHLRASGLEVVKLFLHISREEQRRRFLKRLDLPHKNWKFSASDVYEREWWDQYERAFSQMLSHTSTPWAPWYVIPADHKWFARIAAGAVLVHRLVEIDPRYPTLDGEARAALRDARAKLEAEAPAGAAPDPFRGARRD